MENTNVELSKNEMELVSNAEFILTKNRIIEKVYGLFGMLSESYKSILNEHKENLPAEISKSSPKIYRGENYLSLPYVMMDYPRIFLKENVFTIRSFFWWGNYFSITLQIGGKYFQQYKNSIHQNLKKEINEDYFVCVNDDMWQHHFETGNYKALREVNMEEILQKPFIKIAKKIKLSEWNDAEEFFAKSYAELLKLFKHLKSD